MTWTRTGIRARDPSFHDHRRLSRWAIADEECNARAGDRGIPFARAPSGETIHDFVMLNPLANTPAVRGAIEQAIIALKRELA